jgi:hypothetical protein
MRPVWFLEEMCRSWKPCTPSRSIACLLRKVEESRWRGRTDQPWHQSYQYARPHAHISWPPEPPSMRIRCPCHFVLTCDIRPGDYPRWNVHERSSRQMQGAWHGSIEKICSSGHTGLTALLKVVFSTLRDEATGSTSLSYSECLCIAPPWLICEPSKTIKRPSFDCWTDMCVAEVWAPRSCRHDLDLHAAPHHACTASASWGGMSPTTAIFLTHRCYAFMFLFPCRPPTDTFAASQRPLLRICFSL